MLRSGSNYNLPVPLTSLIGREEDVAAVCRLLCQEAGAVRLLTLTGAAGSGKTRLAICVGNALAPSYPDGVGWVDLSLVVDERLTAHAVAHALDLAVTPQEEFSIALIEYLQSRRLLLILDNCEHVINGCAELVQKLLSQCPQLQILATSRESLKIPGETTWLTPLLSVPRRGTVPLFEELPAYPGICLWVERARAVLPEFRLTPENASAVVQVCQRLDGMPLAIELAAARVRVLSVDQIAARLDDRFRLLKADSRTVLPRNQTLRATIDWSYALLSDIERILLQHLSVFVGGCTLDAVEYMVAGEPAFVDDLALDVLTRLVEKSLVVVYQQDAQPARYDLLETIRQYALEKVRSAGIEAEVRRRHRDWFLQRAESIFPAIGGLQHSSWSAEMETEYENFQAAIGWSGQEPGEAAHGLRLACLMRQYWDRKGYVHRACSCLQELLAHPENSERTPIRAVALNYLGFFTLLHGDSPTATALYEEALAIGQELQDLPTIALACGGLAFVLTGSAAPQQAGPYIQQGLEAARLINDPVQIYNLLYYDSWLALAQGDYQRSHRLLAESIHLMRAENDLNRAAAALWRLGHLCWLEYQYPQSLAAFQESLTLRRSLNNLRGVAYAIDGVAWIAAASGDHCLAARLFGAADLHFAAMDSHFHPLEQPAHDAAVAVARIGLGDPPFATAWEEGKHLSLDNAAELALRLTITPSPVAEKSVPQATSTLLRLYALGPVRVVLSDRTITASDWTYSRARDLLFYLATQGAATREQIGLVFWPDASPEQLRRNLGVTLHHLRKALGRNEWVIFDKDLYTFNCELDYWYDVEAFTDLRQQAQQASDPTPFLQQALALYQGEFVADAGVGEWYFPLREALAQQVEGMLFALAQIHWTAGDLPDAAKAYRQAIAHDPYLESAHRELMRCLAQMGEQAQALRIYTEFARTMKKEFASLPSQETQSLYESLRDGVALHPPTPSF
jgi:predicted ATPase/DNA-binding SARP family transcriptional activator